jgi:carboxyl-terminal processing protease
MTIVREHVVYDQVSSSFFPDDVGYIRIPSFNDRTPPMAKAALEDLGKRGAKALVIDLRQSPGGSFDRAVSVAELFLPDGAGIVTLKRRNKPEEKHVARGGGLLLDLPMAILVDHGTSSGAEFVTAALRDARHARVVGTRTKGKWSVQTVDDLPNGWAFKYTVSMFRTPSGEAFEGTGLPPDVEVTLDEKRLPEIYGAKTPEERIAKDVQYRTARELIVRR